MKGSCPLKTNPDWVSSVGTLGEDKTYELWMVSREGELPEPLAGAFYFYTKENPIKANDLLNKYLQPVTKAQFNTDTNMIDVISVAQDAMFEDLDFKQWLKDNEYFDLLFGEQEEIKRTPEQVVRAEQKLQTIQDLAAEVEDPTGTDYAIDPVALQNNIRTNEIILNFAQKFKNIGFDKPFIVIKAADAKLLLQRTFTPYKGESVFELDRITYYVSDKLSLDTPFSRIAEPLLKIGAKKVYSNAYDSLAVLPEGQMLINRVAARYPLITDHNTHIFKEKVLLEALIEHGNLKSVNATIDKDFNNFINSNLMYHLRQEMRQRLGKISADKINTNTDIESVSDIFNFKIETERITNKDFQEFKTDQERGAREILDAVENDPNKQRLDKKLDEWLNSFVKKTSKQSKELRKAKHAEIRKILVDPESNSAYLTDMLTNLNIFRKDFSQKDLEVYEKMSDNHKAKNLVNSLFLLEKTLIKINEELDKVVNAPEEAASKLALVEQYEVLLNEWLGFIKDSEKHILKAGITRSSFIYGFVSRLDVLVEQGIKSVEQVQEEGSVKITTALLKDFSEKQRIRLDAEIEQVKKTQGSDKEKARVLAKLEKDREQYYYDEQKIRDLYKGNIADSSWFSNMFVSFSSDPDPAIASFALYLKKHLTQIVSRSVLRAKNFTEDIRPLMEQLDMTNANYEKEWKPFLTIDTDQNGNKVYAFMQPTKGWLYDVVTVKRKIWAAKKANDTEALTKAYEELNTMNKVFNSEFSPEYYTAKNQLMKENIEAYDALQEVNSEIEDFRSDFPGQIEQFENHDGLIQLYSKRDRLYSIYDENNKLKDEAGQRIAAALTDYRAKTKHFYESIEKKGKFQRDLDQFAQLVKDDVQYKGLQLYDSEGEMSAIYLKIIDDWVAQNTRVQHTSEYYALTAEIFMRISAYTKELPEEYDLSDLYQKKSAILIGHKDSYGQFNPNLIADNAKRDQLTAELKSIEKEMMEIKEENDDLNLGPELTPKQLEAKRKLKEAFAELSRIQFKKPSEYYKEAMNFYLPTTGSHIFIDDSNATSFVENAKLIDELLEKNDEFAVWFHKNHHKISSTSVKTGKVYHKYKRLDAWSVAEPIQDEDGPQYTQETRYTVNGVMRKVNGVPNSKYFYYRVKNSYVDPVTNKTVQLRTIPFGLTEAERTARYVGSVIDNKGRYLPLSKEQAEIAGVPTTYTRLDDKGNKEVVSYINEDYYRLIENRTRKELLDKITRYTLENQIGAEYADKTYLDLPRLPIVHMQEGIQRGTIQGKWVDKIKGMADGAWAYLSGKGIDEANRLSMRPGEDIEGFSNPQEEKERQELVAVRDGIIDPIADKIPVRGLSNIPIEHVSMDVIAGLNFYNLQLERYKVLSEINPVAKAMLKTLENADQAMEQFNAIREKNAGIIQKASALFKGKKSSRSAAFRALYNREIFGEVFHERHLDWLNKVTGAITGGAAINYFALNLPSAIKNYWGALWQLTVEAAAGEYFDLTSMAKAKGKSKSAMHEWSTRIWGGKYNTVDTMLILMMDPQQGKTEEVIGKDFSRTFSRDLAGLSWTFSPRKYMEMEGALQLMYAVMYHKTIKREINGELVDICYADAFELNDKQQLILKSGIKSTYGITYDENGVPTIGDEFIKTQNVIHEKYKDLNGAFAKFEQPQAQRFFSYRLFAFMRRYFTAMFLHRFGKKRPNFATEEIRTGYYVEAIQSVARTLISLGQSIPFMTPSETVAMRKVCMDVAHIMIVSAAASMIFGYDDDDEDRFAKLRAKSGALGDDDFQLDGWLSNHALTLLLKTQAENDSFIPLPGLGLNNYLDLMSTTSIAFGPTITAAAKLLTDITYHALPGEDETLYYKKDVGPYPWQKEESAKIWNHFFTAAGFSGSQVEPIKGLESFEAYRQ